MRFFYWYLYVLLWLFAFIGRNQSLKNQHKLLAIYCAIWAFVFGFRREDVGSDTPDYAAYFENIGRGGMYGTVDNPHDEIEIGFVFLARVINVFTESPTIVFLLLGFCVWRIVYCLYQSQSKTPLLSLFFLMTVTNVMFYTMQIAIRQSFSVVFLCLGVLLIYQSDVKNVTALLKNKKAICGVLLCVCSIFIHRTTGILSGVLLFAALVNISKTWSYILVFSTTLFSLFAAQYLGELFDTFLLLIGGLSNDEISVLGDRYMGDVDVNHYSKGAILIWAVLGFLLVYINDKSKIKKFAYKVFIISYCINQLLQFSTLHIRIMTPFMILGCLAIVPDRCQESEKCYNLYLALGGFILFISYNWFAKWDISSDSAVPYFFIWQ